MENSSFLLCNDIPWQATALCVSVNYKDELLAATQSPEITHLRATKKLTKEATYMICTMLIFVGLAILGSSITVYESFFKKKEKNAEYQRSGKNEKISRSTGKVQKERKSLVYTSEGVLKGCKSFLKCFCLMRNGRKILSMSSSEGQIACFQGLRFLSNASIICVHFTLMFMISLRFIEELRPLLDLRASHLILNGTFAVDAFFVISGFLNASAFFQKYTRSNGNISWFYFYFKRFVRLTPVYMIVLGFNTTLFTYTGSGMVWPTYDTNPMCQKDWWWYLLYINNFEASAKQCLAWCWSLAADMQFYIVSPLFMVPLIRWPRFGYALILTCISVSSIISFVLTYQYNLIDGFTRFDLHLADSTNFMIKFWKQFDVVYTKPYTRITPYLVSIVLAYYFHKKGVNKGTRNSTVTLFLGWSVTALFMWICFFSFYKKEEILIVTALFNGTKHLLFSCGLAWTIYLCLTGQSEFLNKCLSWKYFLPLSRLSYCTYLIHPLILQRQFLILEDLTDFSYTSLVWLYLHLCIFTYAASFVASMLFEIPVLNLLNWFGKEIVEKKTSKTH